MRLQWEQAILGSSARTEYWRGTGGQRHGRDALMLPEGEVTLGFDKELVPPIDVRFVDSSGKARHVVFKVEPGWLTTQEPDEGGQ